MEKQCTHAAALIYLQRLLGQPLQYGIKSPDMDLYDFGFGETLEFSGWKFKKKEVNRYTLHVTCNFKVIWRTGNRSICKYFDDTPCDKFHSDVNKLIGLHVKRVALSDKNDLWLDLNDCWLVFATHESNEESWRFFTYDKENVHLVAADTWLEMVF